MSDAPETKHNRASIARAWWRALQPYKDQGQPNPTGDRGALARLRRASVPADVLVEHVVLDLYRKLGFRNLSGEWLALTAVAALTLAHARKDTKDDKDDKNEKDAKDAKDHKSKHPAASVGRERFEDEIETAKMKPMRFKRLLSARAPEDLVREMRRLVQLADNKIDVGRLAADILRWRDDEEGDRTRTRWAYEYLAAGRDAPDEKSPPAASPELPQ